MGNNIPFRKHTTYVARNRDFSNSFKLAKCIRT